MMNRYIDIIEDLIEIKNIINADADTVYKIKLIELMEHDVLIYEDFVRVKYLTIKLKEIEMKLKLCFDLENINNEIVADIKFWNNKMLEEI